MDTIHSNVSSVSRRLIFIAFSHWLYIDFCISAHLEHNTWVFLLWYCWHRFTPGSGNPVMLKRQLQTVSGVLRSDQRVPVSVLVHLGKIVPHLLLVIGILRFFGMLIFIWDWSQLLPLGDYLDGDRVGISLASLGGLLVTVWWSL